MDKIIKICKKHGELQEKDVRVYISKGYTCKQCRICNKAWDKKRISSEKRKEYEKNRKATSEYKEKAKIYANNYKERRRIVNLALYHRKKCDPDFKNKNKLNSKKSYIKMKASLNDGYIKKCLKIYKNASLEMIEKKRKEILQHRKLKNENLLKRQIKKNNQGLIDRERKEKGIVKVCKVHGELATGETFFAKNGKKRDNKYYFCKKCSLEKSRDSHLKHREKRLKKQKIYTLNNKQKIKDYHKNYVANLPDKYVARYFVKDNKLKIEEIPKELLEIKKSLIRIKRKIRENNGKK